MVATADGGFIFGGVSLSLDGDVTLPAHGTPPLVYGDYWIVKLSMVSGTDEYTYEPLRIAPNPSSGNITISSDENDPIRFITVFDMLGQPLLQQQIGSDLNIEISALPAGVYLMMGETKSGKMLQGKVVCNR